MQMTEFDIVTLDESLQMIKTFIPYLNRDMQKTFAIMIRIMELISTIRYYNDSNSIIIKKELKNSAEMLNILGQGMPKEMQDSLKSMSQIMQMQDTMNIMNAMNVMNSTNESPENAQSTDEMLANMMDEEQMQMYDEYMRQIDDAIK